VSTKSKNDEIGIQTLVGDYGEKGMNHGRKFYQKIQKISGHEGVRVFMYYWDTRDGPDFCGWWFGNEVGGSEVWSRANSHSQVPPTSGWRIPWDGPPSKDLLIVDQVGTATTQVKTESTSGPPIADKVDAVEAEALQALAAVKRLLVEEEGSADAVSEAESMLRAQKTAVEQTQKALAQDINNARMGGGTPAKVGALAKLSPRLRTLTTNLANELNKIKGYSNTQYQADAGKPQVQERNTAGERRDAKALQDSLPQAMELVTNAEDAVETVAILAGPLNTEDEIGDTERKTMDDIEESAAKAGAALTEARTVISQKLAEAKRYAPETRKVALQEFQALMSKVTEASKKLNPLKKFRQDFEQRAASKKSLEEITAKLNNAELEVEKAAILTNSGDQMTEEDIKATDGLLGPATGGITETIKLAERRARTANDAFKKELESVQERAKQSRDKLEEVRTVLRKQREGLSAQRMLSQAHDKIEKAEEALTATTDAEMPFLKGVENLPQDEALTAIRECETAAGKTETAVDLAKTFLKAKLMDAPSRYSKIVAKRIIEELQELQSRVDTVHKKLREFKKDTMVRKTGAQLHDVVQSVAEAEEQVQTLADVGKVFSSDNLSEVSTEMLKAACEQTLVAEKDASAACAQARKVLVAKQKDAKESSLVAELSQLQNKLTATQRELAAIKKAVASGERLIKSKQVLLDEEEKIKQAELEVAKVETFSTPLGDEKPSDESIKQIDAAVGVAQEALTAVMKSIDLHITSASAMPAFKAPLSKLLARAKKSQEKVDKVKALTREQRERVSCEEFQREASSKAAEVDAALEKVNDAELPFLKGIEELPLSEATLTIKTSEDAADVVQKVIADARTYIAGRTLEVRKFQESIGKPTLEEFQKETERINASGQKLSQFRRDTEQRKRQILLQEGRERLAAVQAEVEKAVVAIKPLGNEDLDTLSPEAATAICEKLAALDKVAQGKVDDTDSFLRSSQKLVRGHASHEEQLRQLQSQLGGLQMDLQKSKKAANEREQKFVAKKLLSEASDLAGEVDAEIERATETAAPLLVEGGEDFLVANNVLQLVDALKERMKQDGASHEVIFSQMANGATSASKGAFKSYLEKIPETLSREDLTFSDAQREAMFKHVDKDKDGVVSANEFEDMFRERFMCVHSISVTDTFDISTSKTVVKLELDEVVESIGEPRVNKVLGVSRLECKLLESGRTGWVTMKGNQGTLYLEPFSPYANFAKSLDRVLEATSKKASSANLFIKQKGAELASCSVGPLVDARGELAKLRPRVSAAGKRLDELKRKVQEARREFAKKEEAEQKAQQEARDRKTAGSVLAAVSEAVAAVEADLQKLEDVARPLTAAEHSALESFGTPISVSKETETLASALAKRVAAAKAVASEQQAVLAKASKGPLHDAKQSLSKMLVKVEANEKKSLSLQGAVKAACEKCATSAAARMASVLREDVQKRSITLDALFLELAAPSKETISEDAFCKTVTKSQAMACSSEQALLLFRHVEADGITRRSFLRILQQYYVCVKTIAITNEFEISKSKTHRMLDLDEVIEVLEGPRSDERLGITRIRGRALSDGAVGWISVKGNQGTPFLKETPKPFYTCVTKLALEPEFKQQDGTSVRMLNSDEVLEVLEGPRRERVGDVVRIRAKTCKDGSTGWMTVKDKEGEVFAEAACNNQYFVCVVSIAMTDVQDIKACKVVRKLEVNETMRILEGPLTEDSTGVSRVRGQSMKDNMIGWVTIKGNAGTVYAEENKQVYTVLRDVNLQRKFQSDSEAVRLLAKDEAVELIEGPKEERSDALVRVRGRAVSDGAMGWVTMKDRFLKPWSPHYRCTNATVMNDALSVKTAATIRKLEVGETVEVVEGPMLEESLDVMRVRARADLDGAVGWVTLKGSRGTPFLVCKAR